MCVSITFYYAWTYGHRGRNENILIHANLYGKALIST